MPNRRMPNRRMTLGDVIDAFPDAKDRVISKIQKSVRDAGDRTKKAAIRQASSARDNSLEYLTRQYDNARDTVVDVAPRYANRVGFFGHRLLNSGAFFAGTNLGLATALHYFGEWINYGLSSLENSAGTNIVGPIQDFFNSHSDLELATKVVAVAPVFIYANKKLILPKTKKIFKKGVKYSRLAADMAIVGSTVAVYSLLGISQNVDRIRDQIRRADSIGDYFRIMIDPENLRFAGRMATGEQSLQAIRNLTDLVDFEPYRVPREISLKIEANIASLEYRNPDFD